MPLLFVINVDVRLYGVKVMWYSQCKRFITIKIVKKIVTVTDCQAHPYLNSDLCGFRKSPCGCLAIMVLIRTPNEIASYLRSEIVDKFGLVRCGKPPKAHESVIRQK